MGKVFWLIYKTGAVVDDDDDDVVVVVVVVVMVVVGMKIGDETDVFVESWILMTLMKIVMLA